jgi:Possible lysine decarboxylase
VLTLMQTGKARVIPVVLLDRPDGNYWETWMKFLTEHLLKLGFISQEDLSFFKIVHDVRQAVAEILQFYKVYQSSRWVGERLVIRISHPLSKKAVVDLNEKFADIVRSGAIVQGTALRQEKNEPEIWNLPRLILTPYRRSFGRFRQLIDAINSSAIA